MTSSARKSMSAAGRNHALLEARTRRLARRRTTEARADTLSCLVCEAGGQLYALPLTQVARVTRAARPAQVVSRNPALLGIAAHAGAFYHVYDLARLVGDQAGGEPAAEGGHAIILRGASHIALHVAAAVRVADLTAVEAAEAANLRVAHPAIAGFMRAIQGDMFEGRTLPLIAPDKLVSADEAERVEGDQA